jgi:hypothetical protein
MKLPAVNCSVSSEIAPKPTRLRSGSYGAVASPFIPAAPTAGSTLRSDKLQGILAKANKTGGASTCPYQSDWARIQKKFQNHFDRFIKMIQDIKGRNCGAALAV